MYKYVCEYIHVHICMYIYICIHINLHICIHIYIYTYIAVRCSKVCMRVWCVSKYRLIDALTTPPTLAHQPS